MQYKRKRKGEMCDKTGIGRKTVIISDFRLYLMICIAFVTKDNE